MKKVIYLLALLVFAVSCINQEKTEKSEPSDKPGTDLVEVADNIIYDVVVKPDSDDAWEQEKIAGYAGEEMINKIFEDLYAGSLRANDFHSGKELSAKEIRKIEKQEGFERTSIGKIQFTEDWYYNPGTQGIEKKVRRMVFGYKTPGEDQVGSGYMAAFEIVF